MEDATLRFYQDGQLVSEAPFPGLLLLPEIPNRSPGARTLSGRVALPQSWASYDVRVEIPSLGVAGEFVHIKVFPLWLFVALIAAGILLYLGVMVLLFWMAHRRRDKRMLRAYLKTKPQLG
jgi:hypothetical protein